MRVQAKIADTFSPYMDSAPVYDALEDYRGPMAAGFALFLHTAIFITFSMTVFLLPPDIIEPDIIPIRIITAAKEDPAPAPAPVGTVLAPAAPSVKPQPKPRPAAPPVTAPRPLPMPYLIEAPDPEPAPAPPPPPILADTAPPAPEDTAVAEPKLVTDEVRAAAIARMQERFEAQNRPQPVPEPIIETPLPEPEIIPEFIPEIIPEVISEIIPDIIPEPLPELVIEPEPIEPIIDPIITEPVPEPEPQIEIFEPLPEPEIIPKIIIDAPLPPDAIIPDAAPGIIIDEPIGEPFEELVAVPLPQPEPDVIEFIDPAPLQTEPEPITAEPILPERTAPIETAPIETAPKVLADSQAPQTEAEKTRAVDKSQAATGAPPARPGGGRQYTTPTLGGGGGRPLFGGGNTAPAPSGVPGRPRPGAGGSWSLSPSTQGDAPTGGLGGISIDMKCRDRFRTHEDCPEYVAKPQGRGADGYESFAPHSIAGSGRGGPPATRRVGSSGNQPGTDFSQHTNGGPSTSVLDDAGFERTFRNNPITVGSPQSDLSGLFGNSEPANALDLTIEDAGEAPEGEDPWSLTEKIKP